MRWVLGCLGVVFVVFGGCVFISGVLAFPSASDTAFLTVVSVGGAVILLFGIWIFYNAVTGRRTRPGTNPPQC
jgi:hypothetical protein